MSRFVTALSAVLSIAALPVAADTHVLDRPVDQGRPNVPEFQPAFPTQTRAPALAAPGAVRAEILATGLDHPWGMAILPDGAFLVTERSGQLRVVTPGGQISAPLAGVPDVAARGQGGLLDVALAHDFADSRRIYLTYSKPVSGGAATALASGRLSADLSALSDVEDLFVQTPAVSGGRHFGSRIVVDGDDIFVTIGDRGTPPDAQDLSGTIGKVVRITPNGAVRNDNPFANQSGARPEIWSYGHRNPQGAAINPATGELWTLEHGPRGGDELNRITKGANYGWPVVSYGENYNGRPITSGTTRADGIVEPRYYWDPVIAPGDFTFYDGDLFDWQGDIVAASLNPGGIVRLVLDGDTVVAEARYLDGELGRVRDVTVAADGSLIVLTDYDDGDIVRITPGG